MADTLGDSRVELTVGAPSELVDAIPQGRAYLFSGTSGIPIHTLQSPDAAPNENFGIQVQMADLTDDTRADILVTAPNLNVGSLISQGRVYGFDGPTGVLDRSLESPNPEYFGAFGQAAIGDVDGDGRVDVVVGAPSETVNANSREGRVYVFSGMTGAVIRTLNTPHPEPNALFGVGLAVARINGDQQADIVVGSPGASVGGTDYEGSVYIFDGATGLLLQDVPNPSPQPHFSGNIAPQFGARIAVGKIDSDLITDLLVGATGQDVGGNQDQGRVYGLSGSTGAVISILENPSPQAGACFGCLVHIADLDRDSVDDLIIGAFRQDVGAYADQGRLYVLYQGQSGNLETIDSPNASANSFFGFSVSTGDVLGSDSLEILIGAPGFGSNRGRAYLYSLSAPDNDLDGITDADDPDDDNDGIPDSIDSCPLIPGLGTDAGCPPDNDNDGTPDATDPDDDNDGSPDVGDGCPNSPGPPGNNGCPFDNDGDGIPDDTDPDDDNDGIADTVDGCPTYAGGPQYDGCPPPGPPAVGGKLGLVEASAPPTALSQKSVPDTGFAAAAIFVGSLGSILATVWRMLRKPH